ncbi:MAG: copper resistance protein CopC [Caldilineaceae bacterium]|nr:copper resistance protein CopC [Caldilineaceae bacterium]
MIAALFLLLISTPALGHAALERSEPAANAVLAEPPAEIRLWFSEPPEPQFSGIELRDSRGEVVATPASQVDGSDPYQLALQPGDLPDGLYTVVWWATSVADGHRTEGSFPVSIGVAGANAPAVINVDESIPVPGSLIRWLNFVSLALLAGGLGFACCVWRPAVDRPVVGAERWMHVLIWVGWALVGLSSVLLLMQQTSVMAKIPLGEVLGGQAWREVATSTRFGTLWLARVAAWGVMGLLLFRRRGRSLEWLALAGSLALLLTVCLYSHAAAAEEALPSVLIDWLHLCLTVLWVGGLVHLLAVLGPIRRTVQPAAPLVGRIVGYFSNYARMAVAGLVITGAYAAWLQVGSVEALVHTLYGRLLAVKLLLFLPLLAIAGVNLLWTHRALLAGQEIWTGRLRRLVAAEVVLAMVILAAVGTMTSISPARSQLALQQAAAVMAALPPPPEPQPFSHMEMVDDLHVHLTITPGWVGMNTFEVELATMDGAPVSDASLIRLRFEDIATSMGTSELRITEGPEGMYKVEGANLSAPGDWQIRMTIQRPDQYDTVVDFLPPVVLPPSPPPAPAVEIETPRVYQSEAILATGLLLVMVGGYFLVR